MINAAKKRAIIFISGGSDSALNFDSYNLSQLTAYMCNNSIMFSVIQVTQGAVNPQISYISENTNGDMYYVYREEGLSNIVNEIIQSPQGIYQLSYMSMQTTNMGEKYLPAEIEVYLLNRSGRDETGYFAPLQ